MDEWILSKTNIRYAINQHDLSFIHLYNSLHFKSGVKYLHRPVHLFLHPYLTNSLHFCLRPAKTKILSSASSILHGIKHNNLKPSPLVTTFSFTVTALTCISFTTTLTNKGTIQPYLRYISGTSSSLLEEGNYQ